MWNLKCRFQKTPAAKHVNAAITVMYSILFINGVPQIVYHRDIIFNLTWLVQEKSK